jgi:hypothetical protein
MAKKNMPCIDKVIDCACVIHGTVYDWQYVEKLYNMLTRLIPAGIRFHVYTEPDREVPDHMIKHELDLWNGISGPRRSWWYKMQLFNPKHHAGNLLYLDLDVVIIRELDWVSTLSTDYLWGIRDFKYLQNARVRSNLMNSSMMWWNVSNFAWVWDQFSQNDVNEITRKYPGDQDYLTQSININKRRFFEDRYFESYRWQALDGGYDFKNRKHFCPDSGFKIKPETAVLVFHGTPKPHQIKTPEIQRLWG